MGEVFYFAGIGLTLVAVAVAFLGLRNKEFPSSREAMLGGIALFALLVVATASTAVINAEDEQETRENEQAAEAAEEADLENQAEQSEEIGEPGAGAAGEALEQEGAGGGGAPSGASGAIDLTAPEDGSFAFDPDSLEAPAGEVTIAFTNPASVEHDVHIERDGEELGASDLVADGDTADVSAELEPGEYVYFCGVPGHREGGMEGTLTVK